MELVVHTYLSPRIIEILEPTEDISVQEIVNALRDWEDALPEGMAYAKLLDAAGKEALGPGLFVGITATLQNARLMFQPRLTALATGQVTSADPTGQHLHATGADFVASGIYPGCTVMNLLHPTLPFLDSMAVAHTVVTPTHLWHFPLAGGSRNTWQIGDKYAIYENVQCAITGGNLVAVDEAGDPIDVILPSTNTQVVMAAATSAALLEAGAESEEEIARLLGLAGENQRLKDQVYDSLGNMTSATLRIYPTAADCTNDTNQTAEYAITASYTGRECTAYKMVKL